MLIRKKKGRRKKKNATQFDLDCCLQDPKLIINKVKKILTANVFILRKNPDGHDTGFP